MDNRTQNQRLEWLVDELCWDSDEYKALKVNSSERRATMRSLMNIRIPKPISSSFLKIQNEFLEQESLDKGIVTLEDIPTIGEQYHSNYLFADKISIWQGDITRLQVDAIVNAANSQMLGCFVPCHNCIDNAIHSAAGIQLRNECFQYMQTKRKENRHYEEPVGKAVITKAYSLPSKYILHTVGPIVRGELNEFLKEDLHSCYHSCMHVAIENEIRSISFCCISTGEYQFPNEEAAKIAVEEIDKILREFPDKFDRIIFNVFKDIDRELYKRELVN